MREMNILSPTAILGYGFPEASFREGLRRNPALIAVDAGSTDPGPYYLGSGLSFTDREAVKRDLALLIPAGLERRIPLVVGSCGGSGADSHVEWTLDIVREIARELGLSFKLALVSAEISHETVRRALAVGRVRPLPPAPPLTEAMIAESTAIVAQMGLEPLTRALDMGADVILAGRAYDPAVFAALAVKNGFDPGLAIHMGKILECAAIAATPGSGSDCMLGVLREDSFVVEPLSGERKCTVLSVAAHTLYEKSNPLVLPGPGGVLDLNHTSFTQISDRAVEVRGSRFLPCDRGRYTIKLEAARLVGFRALSFAATADPVMIGQMDAIVDAVKTRVKANFQSLAGRNFFLDVKIYGRHGVMAMFDKLPAPESAEPADPAELGLIIEAVADTQAEADTICAFARSTLLHFGYPGRKSTAGNLAFPFSPSDFHAGAVYEFSLYHLMEVDDPCAHFPVTMRQCRQGECHDL